MRAFLFLAFLLALPAYRADAGGCELALLLAIDISGSVDDAEYQIQVQGMADALEDPEIGYALLNGNVAVAVVQWSSIGMQKMVQPWQRMESGAVLQEFARAARQQERAFGKADTAVGDALAFAVSQFDAVPDCRRRVIDISGDGVQNAGGALPPARDLAIRAGISINAIAIEGIGLAISEFYRKNVITRGGFVVTATGHTDYPRALRLKILREVARPMG